MENAQIIENAAQRSLELSEEYEAWFKESLANDTYTEQEDEARHLACRVSFEINGQKYRVLRQEEATANGGYARRPKITTRYYIVKKVGKRVIKEKDSPFKLANIL